MSSETLTEDQITLLKKGLKFTPTPRNNMSELECDIKTFCRRLRLKENFFNDSEIGDESSEDEILVKNKSNWTPKPKRNDLLDNCIDHLNTIAKSLPEPNGGGNKSNISKNLTTALSQLQNNPNIIIKKADKGGAVCVMDRTFYCEKITEMLNNTTTYREISEIQSKQTLLKIRKLINKHKLCLKDEEIAYLLDFESKESNFYGLPKVHKCNSVKEAIKSQNSEYIIVKNPTDLTFRPIVAGPECPTSRLSHLMDILLKDLPPLTKSYVRDDIDFLSKLQRNLCNNESHSLVTFDVESLYTNINHELGIEAIKYWLNKYNDTINQRFSHAFICDAILTVLENNTFFFNNKFYLQTNGTAMGTKMAPTYAILVLAFLEERLYEKLQIEKGIDYSTFVQEGFLRYIDDCFIIWPHTKWNLLEFNDELNNLHPQFKFTMESSIQEIAFLDIKVYITNNSVKTDIYYKATDTHQFLTFDSCHPRHTKTSIPYCEARRLCTIIDDTERRDIRLEEMKRFLLSRGYPSKLIEDSIRKACAIPQHILRQPKPKTTTDTLPFVTTHNPNNPNLVPIIKSTLQVLKQDKHMNKVLQSSKFIASKRQAPNLGKLLTRAKFSENKTKGGSFKCGDKRCANCKYMNETNIINIKSTGRNFEIKQNLTCKSSNVLYIITCNGCQEQYVGMTNNTLAKRFTVHRQQINNSKYRQIGVSEHIDKCCSHDIKFTVTPFYKISSDKTTGETKEQLFIQQFKPSLNKLSLSHN